MQGGNFSKQKFFGEELSKGNYTQDSFTRILTVYNFFSIYFLFINSTLHVEIFHENCPGKLFWGISPWGGREFCGRNSPLRKFM